MRLMTRSRQRSQAVACLAHAWMTRWPRCRLCLTTDSDGFDQAAPLILVCLQQRGSDTDRDRPGVQELQRVGCVDSPRRNRLDLTPRAAQVAYERRADRRRRERM